MSDMSAGSSRVLAHACCRTRPVQCQPASTKRQQQQGQHPQLSQQHALQPGE